MLWAAKIHQSQLICKWILPTTDDQRIWLKAYERGDDSYPWRETHPLFLYQQLDKNRLAIHHKTPKEFIDKYNQIKAERKQAAIREERKNWWVPNPSTRAMPPLNPSANVQLPLNPFHEGNNLPRAHTTWGWTTVFEQGDHPEYLHLL